MKRFHRDARAAQAAGLGLSILLFPALFTVASAQDRSLTASHMTEEPTEDPEVDPAYIEKKAPSSPEAVIREWPNPARVTARAMIEKYGEPNHYTAKALVWVDNGPWKRTVIYEPRLMGKNDFLEQTVAYHVPSARIEDLRRFDHRITVDQAGGELSVRSSRESANFLALNLADEIVSGARSVRGARDFYVKTLEFTKAGMASPYMDRLLFASPNDDRAGEFH